MLTAWFCHLSTLIPNDPITMKLRLMVKPGCWFHSAANHLFSPSARKKLIFFNPRSKNISIIMWHGRQRKAFLFHPNISPKVVTYFLFPKVLILNIFSFFSLVLVRYMCSCGWCDEENGLYDPNKWLCLQYKLLHVFVKIVMCICQSWYIHLLTWEMMKRVVFIILTNDFASNIGLFLVASISLLIRRSGS